MHRTADAISDAKNALIRALRAAEQENYSPAIVKKIDSLAAMVEKFQAGLTHK